MNRNIQDKQLLIVDGQLIGCILYILSFVVTIIIIINQRRSILNKDKFIESDVEQIITLLNKIFDLLLILLFLYLNYKSKKLAQELNQDTNSLNLQIISSIISIIPALIGLYVVLTDFSNTSFQTADIENPYV